MDRILENFKTVKAVWEKQKGKAEGKNIAGFEMGYIDGNIEGLDFAIKYIEAQGKESINKN